jgi:hypothetical protein
MYIILWLRVFNLVLFICSHDTLYNLRFPLFSAEGVSVYFDFLAYFSVVQLLEAQGAGNINSAKGDSLEGESGPKKSSHKLCIFERERTAF